MSNISDKLTVFFDTHLPIAEYMGLNVESYDGKTLVLNAPLNPNINDKLTAFGGSLYNVAVLACWGIVYLKVGEYELDCDMVVTKGNVAYKAPVKGEIRAICHAPEQEQIKAFVQEFREQGRAKIALESTIECSGNLAVEFAGQYAILRK
jgi:thioesterase domain-containing protein